MKPVCKGALQAALEGWLRGQEWGQHALDRAAHLGPVHATVHAQGNILPVHLLPVDHAVKSAAVLSTGCGLLLIMLWQGALLRTL